MKTYITIFTVILSLWLVSCSGYVNGIDSPINNISDTELNTPSDVKVLTIGLFNDWSTTWDGHSMLLDALSDALEFHRELKGATYPSYESIDLANVVGDYPLDDRNSTLAGQFRKLGRLRLLADTLIHRVQHNVKFTTEEELKIKNEALYYGYFFAGIARYMYAYSWALTPSRPGGVINKSPLIPSNRMYEYAIEYLLKAKAYATQYQKNVINTIIARIYMILRDYQSALDYAEGGLTQGDEDFTSRYSTVSANIWNLDASILRVQFCAADRFGDYVYHDVKEAKRIPLKYVESDTRVEFDKDTVIAGIKYHKGQNQARAHVIQNKYNTQSCPIVFTSWRENFLMLGELYYRLAKDVQAALDQINVVRKSHNLAPISKAYVEKNYENFYEFLIEERDKELCFTGLRIMDQRRFNKWHRGMGNSWMYFPITLQEKLNNPNLKPTVRTRDPKIP